MKPPMSRRPRRPGPFDGARDWLRGVSPLMLGVVSAIAAVWLWYILYRCFGDGVRGLGLINAFGYGWAALALVCAIIAAVRRAWIAAAAAVVIAAVILAPLYSPLPAKGTATQRMRVVTASLRDRNPYMAEVATSLGSLKPDILLVQEASDPEAFLAGFMRDRPGWNAAVNGNLIIASRWPLRVTRREAAFFRASVTLPDGPLTVWNVHAPKYYLAIIENRRFFASLVDDIATSGRGIAGGDYNAAPWNEGYDDLDAVMDDGYRRTRWTPGFTFPGPARRSGLLGPLITIDHIFATPDLKPVDAFVASPPKGVDHLPVVVDYALPGAP